MFQDLRNLPGDLRGLRARVLQQPGWILAAGAWFLTAGIGIVQTSAASILSGRSFSSHIEERDLVRTIAETAASNQEDKKGIKQDDDAGSLCVKRMDACYENCKPGETQPGTCNLSCTTDKICGMPVRLSYGQFLDFQVEMLATNTYNFAKTSQQNANSSPAQAKALPERKPRAQQNRSPGTQTKPASGRPSAASAGTGAAGNGGWPHLTWPQLSWPPF
jgi:hypothetical protein